MRTAEESESKAEIGLVKNAPAICPALITAAERLKMNKQKKEIL